MENSALISSFLSLDLRKWRRRKYRFIYSSLSAQLSSKIEKNLHMWPECSLVLSKALLTLPGVVSVSAMLKRAQFGEEMLLCVSSVAVLSEAGGMCRGSRAEEILSLPLLKSSACMQPEIEMKDWSWDCTGALLAAVRGNVPQVTSLCSHWGHTGCEKDNQLLYCYTSAAPV